MLQNYHIKTESQVEYRKEKSLETDKLKRRLYHPMERIEVAYD